MLSQLQELSRATDGRYASDEELRFLAEYVRAFRLRVQTYQKLQSAESTIVEQVYAQMQARDANIFKQGKDDLSRKWKVDTVRVLRYTAVAVLMNDPDTLRERFLFWFQTVMKAFGAQKHCRVTYEVMQDVVKQTLAPQEASLVCPILEINRQILGIS
jgi:hypothetical protein